MTAAVYLILAVGMFYFTTETVSAGGIGFMYRFLFGIGIAAMAVGSFLIRPRLKRVVLLSRYSVVLSAPYMVPLFFSFVIWILRFESFRFMLKGSFYVLYEFLGICVAAATIYLFGKKGIWYCLAAMLTAYSIHIVQVILTGGAAAFFDQFFNLVVSFGNRTGDLMREVESHDFVFALWVFVLYLLLTWRKAERKGRHFLLVAVTLFFACVGLKRIAVLGVAAALLLVTLLSFLPEAAAKRGVRLVGYCIIAAAFLYIIAVHMGLFTYLEEVVGIDTMGRDQIYEYLNTQYDISPFYLGKGVAFDSKPWDTSAMRNLTIHQNAFHNDFVRMYIELGFWGFLLWLWLYLVFQPGYFMKHQGIRGGLYYMGYCIFNSILYTTDNTVYYFYGNLVIFMLAMSYQTEELEEKELAVYEEEWSRLEEPDWKQPFI